MHINTVHFTNPAKQDWTMCNLLYMLFFAMITTIIIILIVHLAILFRSYCCYFIRYYVYSNQWRRRRRKRTEHVVNGLVHIDLEHCSKFSNVWIKRNPIWCGIACVAPFTQSIFELIKNKYSVNRWKSKEIFPAESNSKTNISWC